MKAKHLLAAAALLLSALPSQAQEWRDILKKAATEVADQLTDGKLTQYALTGTWNYTGPGVKFEGEDLLSGVGGTAMESTVTSRLEKAYLLAGIKPGACSFTFAEDKSFTATMGNRQLSGTYEFDAGSHLLTLHFAKGKIDLGSVPGHAYVSGTELQLLFPVTRLTDMVVALGSRISSLSTVAKLLEKYENVYIGFRFGK